MLKGNIWDSGSSAGREGFSTASGHQHRVQPWQE